MASKATISGVTAADPIQRTDLDLEGLTWAVQANWEALAAHLADEHGGWFETLHGMVRFSTGLHSGFLNGVLSADVELEDLPGALALTRHVFGPDLPWRWIVGPSSHPEGLELELEALGLERRWPRMLGMSIDLEGANALDPSRLPPTGRLAEVEDGDGLEAWLSVRRRNLGLDEETTGAWRTAHGKPGLGPEKPLRHWVGWLDDEPVAGATLFVGAGTAGIYHVDTVEEARGKGFAGSLTSAALLAARELGYRYGVLTASALGESVYRRLGFRELPPYAILIGGPATT
jgi:predicted GNAT family acetyltransferase